MADAPYIAAVVICRLGGALLFGLGNALRNSLALAVIVAKK